MKRPVPVIAEPIEADIDRIRTLLRRVGGPSVSWGAVDVLNVWVVEQRAALDR